MELILNALPAEVLRYHIATFLGIKDLMRLDTACANKRLSPTLRDTLLCENILQQLDYIGPCTIYWMVKRKLSINKLTFHSSVLDVDVLSMRALFKNVMDVSFDDSAIIMGESDCIRSNVRSNISDISVQVIARHCPGLIHLNLNGCVLVTDKTILAVADNCRKLQSLQIAYCDNVTDSALVRIAQCCTDLRWLNISFVDRSWKASTVTDMTLEALARHCRRLEWLEYQYSYDISITALVHLITQCPNITHLDCGTVGLNTQAAEAIVKNLSKLRYLRLHTVRIEKDTLESVWSKLIMRETNQKCIHLHTLHIGWYDHTLLDIIRVSCPNLQRLYLKTPSNDSDDTRVIDALLQLVQLIPTLQHLMGVITEEMLPYCTELQALSLTCYYDWALSNNFILKIGQCCRKLKRLEFVWTRFKSAVTVWEQLCVQCCDLETLSFRHCEGNLDEVISIAAQYCKKLKSIAVHNCGEFTDVGIAALVEHCSSLVSSELISCGNKKKITDWGILQLIDNEKSLPRLKRIVAEPYDQFSEESHALIANCLHPQRPPYLPTDSDDAVGDDTRKFLDDV